jgi:hypothetical protein
VKRLLFAAAAAVLSVPALANDVNVSVGISQPGFYGQINIGDFPRPAVIYAEPLWVARPAKVAYVQPIYLHVPPGHEKHWSKHCAAYGACGRPVYFVREDWYQTQYVPRYVNRDYDDHGENHGHGQEGQHGHEGRGHDGRGD